MVFCPKRRAFQRVHFRLRGLANRVHQIEEAVDFDRFLLAVAEHPKVREELLLLRSSLLRGSFLRSLSSFLLCHSSTPYRGIWAIVWLAWLTGLYEFDEHHTLMSDLPTVIGRGEPHAPNVRRSDFSDPKREMNLVFDSLRVTTAIRC